MVGGLRALREGYSAGDPPDHRRRRTTLTPSRRSRDAQPFSRRGRPVRPLADRANAHSPRTASAPEALTWMNPTGTATKSFPGGSTSTWSWRPTACRRSGPLSRASARTTSSWCRSTMCARCSNSTLPWPPTCWRASVSPHATSSPGTGCQVLTTLGDEQHNRHLRLHIAAGDGVARFVSRDWRTGRAGRSPGAGP